MSDGIVCPNCDGEKQQTVFADGHHPDGTRWGDIRTVACNVCRGVGTITSEHQQRIDHGKRLRAERVAKGLTLREAARLEGVTASEISAREFGRATPAGSER